MKPIPAIVESDIARHAAAVDQVLSRIRDAERHVSVAEERVVSAREVVARLRLDLGHALAAARKAWPPTGPRAKGWTDFLRARGLDPDVADDAMKYAGYVAERFSGTVPEKLPTRREAGLDDRPLASDRDTKPANVIGGSGEKPRGAYCTPEKYAIAVGPWDLDPFSNPRSHIVATDRCMLEDGGDGFGDLSQPGSYRLGGGEVYSTSGQVKTAGANTRTWLQPPYGRKFIERVVAHYGHTRFCALLRWAPDTKWFAAMWPLVQVVAFPLERIPFETPSGVVLEGAEDDDEDRGAPYPHAFYYSDPRDVTDEIARLCIVLSRYQAQAQPALHIVR